MRTFAALLAFVLTLPALAGRLYVTNERAGTVQVIDTATDRVIRTIVTGNRPRGVVVSPDGKRVYVARSWWHDGKHPRTGKEAILAIDAATFAVAREYPAGTDPEGVALSPDGKQLYLSNEDAGTASIVDVATARTRATLVVGTEPEGVTASPDGKWVYVTAETSNVISVIDVKQARTSANILVDPRPRYTLFTRDSATAFATAEIGGSVMRIDVQKKKVVDRIRLSPGDKPVGMALSPDQKRLYVALGRGNGVAVIDLAARRVISRIATGSRVWGIALTRDGRKLYAANSLSNTVSAIDTATNRVVATIPTGDGPWGLACHD